MSGADTAHAPPVTVGAGRLLGVDAARAVALLGMMATHLIPRFEVDGRVTPAFAIADGRASALFALVAGMSLALADGGARGGPGVRRYPFGVMALRLGVRAAIIGTAGMVLALTDPPILLILTYYGLLFLLVAPLLRLPGPALAVLAVLWAIVAPVASHLIRREYGLLGVITQPSFTDLVTDPLGLARQLLLTGMYPAGTWLAYVLAGAALGRIVLTPYRLAWCASAGLLLATGAHAVSQWLLAGRGTAVLERDTAGFGLEGRFFGSTPTSTWWWLAIDTPHSGTPLDLIATTGSAVLVIALLLLIFRTRAATGLKWLALTGSMTLTLYSFHVIATRLGLPPGLSPGGKWLVHVLVAVLVALIWRSTFSRGPLEALVAGAVTAVTPRAVRERVSSSPTP